MTACFDKENRLRRAEFESKSDVIRIHYYSYWVYGVYITGVRLIRFAIILNRGYKVVGKSIKINFVSELNNVIDSIQ